MKKTATILSLCLLSVMLTTFNPNLNFGFQFFKIKHIEVKNLKFLEKKKI